MLSNFILLKIFYQLIPIGFAYLIFNKYMLEYS